MEEKILNLNLSIVPKEDGGKWLRIEELEEPEFVMEMLRRQLGIKVGYDDYVAEVKITDSCESRVEELLSGGRIFSKIVQYLPYEAVLRWRKDGDIITLHCSEKNAIIKLCCNQHGEFFENVVAKLYS
jgi:hypothetical protein